MPGGRSFTRGQWEALGRRLDALPEKLKDDQPVKVGDGIKSIRTQIGTAREKGYTLGELIEQAAQEGIDVTLNSLRYAMRRAEGNGRARRSGKEAARKPGSVSARGRKSSQVERGFAALTSADPVPALLAARALHFVDDEVLQQSLRPDIGSEAGNSRHGFRACIQRRAPQAGIRNGNDGLLVAEMSFQHGSRFGCVCRDGFVLVVHD